MLQEAHFRQHQLGDFAGIPLVAWSRLVPDAKTTIYLSSGIHGDEPAGPLALIHWMQRQLPSHVNWLICPLLNPRGHARGCRCNTDDIDLNRDYLQPRSEEIRAHIAWLETMPCPNLSISLHEDWETSGFYFYEINQAVDCPQRYLNIVKAVEPLMAIEPMTVIDDHVTRAPGWIDHRPEADIPEQWPEAIFLAKRGCPLSFTFETPSQAAKLEQRVAALSIAIQTVIDEHLQSCLNDFSSGKSNGI